MSQPAASGQVCLSTASTLVLRLLLKPSAHCHVPTQPGFVLPPSLGNPPTFATLVKALQTDWYEVSGGGRWLPVGLRSTLRLSRRAHGRVLR